MKKLQSNFTTPEQSKRLLELGVPAWTADEYLDENGLRYSLDGVLDVGLYFQSFPNDTPCWSVGRLIEVFEICTRSKFKRVRQTDDLIFLSPLEDILLQIEHNACGFYDNTKWDTNLLN